MFSFNVPLFDRRVFFYLGDGMFPRFAADCRRRYKQELELDNMVADGIVLNGSVWINDPDDYGVVAHELFHLTENIAKTVGVEDAEAKAYVMEYLTDAFYRKTKDKPRALPVQVGGEDAAASLQG